MKLGPVTKLDKRNAATSKKIGDDVIVKFSTYDQFSAIWKLDFKWMVSKTYIFINSNLLSYKKTENRSEQSLTQLSYYWFK